MIEFALVLVLAVPTALAVVQLALFLYERNVVMSAVAEGARTGATYGRSVTDGVTVTRALLDQTVGGRAVAVAGRTVTAAGVRRVEISADGHVPSLVPLVPELHISMRAAMADEESLWGAPGSGP